ncbi:hypothetical protein [Altererythrobacter litoralis]|uniref:Porin n=1 Tax=Altererythrobacter litoralis TaxID=3113904 RepID=A0ABU7GCD8_9SPHN|nr:hypothetical protein [Erythrobacteraceae bacterium 1XM1-14]
MKLNTIRLGLMVGAMALGVPAIAQDAPEPAANAEMEATTAAEAKPCELHVWPTENYIGIKMGLIVGLRPCRRRD